MKIFSTFYKNANKFLLIVLFGSCIFINKTHSQSTYHPDDFHDFFSDIEQNIHVILAGERTGKDILAITNYEDFRIEKYSESDKLFRQFLQSKSIKNEIVELIMNKSYAGIRSDEECKEWLNQCVLSINDEQPRYIFDFDSSILKIFIPSNAIKQDVSNIEYESAINKGNGIVNWSNLYGYTDLSGNQLVTFSNLTTIGLPIGFLTFDTQYQSENSNFDVYTAIYDIEYNGHRLQTGRNNYNLSFNSTDMLNSGANYSGDTIAIGSSNNLLKGNKEELQRIYFYAPQSGQLEIYREDRLIFNKVVNEGKQYISYAELPKGAYDAVIILKVAGKEVLTENRQIVNNNQFSLLKGSSDYLIEFGKLDKFIDGYQDEDEKYNKEYVKLLSSYRMNENLILSGGFITDKYDQMYQLGGTLFIGNKLSLEYVSSTFSSADFYQYATLAYSPFFIDFKKMDYDMENNSNRLSGQLYNDHNYKDFGVGVSASIWNNSMYLRYSNYYSENKSNYYNDYSDVEYKLLTGGISRQLSKGSININVDYSKNDNDSSELRTNLTWVYKFDDAKSTQVTVYSDRNGFDYNANSLRFETAGNNWSTFSSVGVTVNKDNQINTELSTTAMGNTEQLNGNIYAYLQDQGTKTLSGGISGTQVISENGVAFTKEKGRSFLEITKEMDVDRVEDAERISYVLSHDGQYSKREELIKDTTLLKLEDYKLVDVNIYDPTDSVGIHNDQYEHFVHPGTVHQLNTKIISLNSKIVLLEDLDGKPVLHVQCIGDGCVSVETLSDDGVFRVNHQKSQPYRLISRKGICIFDEKSEESYTYGYCLPGLDMTRDDQNWQKSSSLLQEKNNNELLMYLGKFQQGIESQNIIEQLEQLEISFKNINVAKDVYIYIVQESKLNKAQRILLEELDAYVLLRNSELDLLTIKYNQQKHDGV